MDNGNTNQENSNNWWGGEAQPVQPTQPVQSTRPMQSAQPVQQEVMQPGVVQAEQMDTMQPAQPKKNNRLAIILGAVVGVLAIVAIVIVAMMNLPSGSEAPSGGAPDATGNSGSSNDNSGDEVVENTELASGTVTTTIDGKTVTYKGAYVVDGIQATIGSGTYESVNDDETVFLVINGGSLIIKGDVIINKTGSSDFAGRGDNYSFYGLNSAVVVVGEGSELSIDGATINTSVSGANAVVAVNGGEAGVVNTTISTTKDNSRGLHATYGGSIVAADVKISTQGGSSAALATDRGSGTVIANIMDLATAGAGSPLIYSTGTIKVSNSTGTATGAQIAVVEGKNSVEVASCDFSANGIGNRNAVDNAGVMIYQSMSGDASVGKGSFTAVDSTLTVLSSSSVYTTTPLFFVTNTDAEITLTDVTANFYPDGYFILAAGTEEWGKAGSNGGAVVVSASGLNATNVNVAVDEISSVSGL